jgi:hypothetical protein
METLLVHLMRLPRLWRPRADEDEVRHRYRALRAAWKGEPAPPHLAGCSAECTQDREPA